MTESETMRIWEQESEQVRPIIGKSLEVRGRTTSTHPPSFESFLPKETVRIEELIDHTDEELKKINLSWEKLEELIDNEIPEIEVPKHIETDNEALEIYGHYADGIIKKAIAKIELSKSKDQAVIPHLLNLAKGTFNILTALKERMDEKEYQEAQDKIFLSSELIMLTCINDYNISFDSTKKGAVMSEVVDYLARDPEERMGVLDFVRQRFNKASLEEKFGDIEVGIRGEVITSTILARSKTLEMRDLYVSKSTADQEEKGIDLVVSGILQSGIDKKQNILVPELFIDVKKEFHPGVGGICVVIPDNTSEKKYKVFQSGLESNESIYRYGIKEESINRHCVEAGIPFVVIRMPTELAVLERAEALKKAGTFDLVYNQFASWLESEIQYALDYSKKKPENDQKTIRERRRFDGNK